MHQLQGAERVHLQWTTICLQVDCPHSNTHSHSHPCNRFQLCSSGRPCPVTGGHNKHQFKQRLYLLKNQPHLHLQQSDGDAELHSGILALGGETDGLLRTAELAKPQHLRLFADLPLGSAKQPIYSKLLIQLPRKVGVDFSEGHSSHCHQRQGKQGDCIVERQRLRMINYIPLSCFFQDFIKILSISKKAENDEYL